MKVIYLGDDRFNADWLCSVTEQYAVLALKGGHKTGQIRNAWKQANGLTVPNYDSTEKPKKKKKEEGDS